MTPLRLPILLSIGFHIVFVVVLILLPLAAKAVFEPRQITLYLMDPVSSASVVEPAEALTKPEPSLTPISQPTGKVQPQPARHVVRATNQMAARAAIGAVASSVPKAAEPAPALVPRFIEMPRSFDTAGPRLVTSGEGLNLPAEMISSAGALPNIAIIAPPSRPVLAAGAGSRHLLRDISAEREGARRSKARPGHDVRAEYPRIAKEAGWEGVVMLRVEILADGKAGSVSVHGTSGYPILDDAALNAVQRWRFTPAMDGNFPVKSVVKLPIRFYLSEQ